MAELEAGKPVPFSAQDIPAYARERIVACNRFVLVIP